MNYNNKKFRLISSSQNSEVSEDVVFYYKQEDNILTCIYSGGTIVKGHLIGLVKPNGEINMHYHQINKKGEIKSGVCNSIPEQLANGKIRLLESWKWTSEPKEEGNSILEEV